MMNKLQLKLIEKRAEVFARSLQGVSRCKVLFDDDGRFEKHSFIVKEHFSISSTPLQQWPQSADKSEIEGFLCMQIERLGPSFFMPYEKPFYIELQVSNPSEFIRSLVALQKTWDIRLHSVDLEKVIDLQDAEYDVFYFEAYERRRVSQL